jgi:hypothetical protein
MKALNTTSLTIKGVLAAAPATTQPTFEVSYGDHSSSTYAGKVEYGTFSGTTAVTVLSAPSTSNREHIVKSITIYNKDTASVTATIYLDDGTTTSNLQKVTLLAGYFAHYEAGHGWYTASTDGSRLGVGATGAQGPQGPQGATGATGPQGVKGDTGATGPRCQG